MKIIDCFIFYNEVDLLRYRLRTLNSIVDHFVIIEANQTFMGKPKELYSAKVSSLLEEFNGKLTHMIINLPFREGALSTNKDEQWKNENFQRNSIGTALKQLPLKDDDIIIISDVDEIPDPNTLYMIKCEEIHVTINCLEQDFFYYNLQSKFLNKWYHAKLIRYGLFKKIGKTCDEIRHYDCVTISPGGWHLSYFGDKEFIRNKIQNFSHAEHNIPETIDLDNIQRCIDSTECIVGKEFRMTRIPLSENNYLPPNYERYLNMF